MTNIIKISREFSNNQLGNLWLGREIEIDSATDPIEAFIKANEELVNAYGRLSGGNGVGSDSWEKMGDIKVYDYVLPPKESRLQSISDAIRSCTDIKILESYRLIAKTEDELQKVYDETMGKLQK